MRLQFRMAVYRAIIDASYNQVDPTCGTCTLMTASSNLVAWPGAGRSLLDIIRRTGLNIYDSCM